MHLRFFTFILIIFVAADSEASAEASKLNPQQQNLHQAILLNQSPEKIKQAIFSILNDGKNENSLLYKLLKAIMNNSTEEIKQTAQLVINHGKDARAPIFWAVLLKRFNAIEILLDCGADANEELIEQSLKLGDIKSAVLLATKGSINLNAIYFDRPLLVHALQRGDIQSALLLVKSGAEILYVNHNRDEVIEAILRLIESPQKALVLELVQELINHGYNIHSDHYYRSIWLPAIQSRAIAALELFIKNGANPNQVIDISKPLGIQGAFLTPLFIAITYGTKEIVKVLLDSGANINQKAYPELYDRKLTGLHTPLSCAAACGKSGMIEYLIERGANF